MKVVLRAIMSEIPPPEWCDRQFVKELLARVGHYQTNYGDVYQLV